MGLLVLVVGFVAGFLVGYLVRPFQTPNSLPIISKVKKGSRHTPKMFTDEHIWRMENKNKGSGEI